VSVGGGVDLGGVWRWVAVWSSIKGGSGGDWKSEFLGREEVKQEEATEVRKARGFKYTTYWSNMQGSGVVAG
jgi:hypothetical protein